MGLGLGLSLWGAGAGGLSAELGEGWKKDGTNAWTWTPPTSAQYPSLDFGGIIAGVEYQTEGRVTAYTQAAATANVRWRLGYGVTDSWSHTFGAPFAPFDFNEIHIAGSDNTLLRAIIDDNTRVGGYSIANMKLTHLAPVVTTPPQLVPTVQVSAVGAFIVREGDSLTFDDGAADNGVGTFAVTRAARKVKGKAGTTTLGGMGYTVQAEDVGGMLTPLEDWSGNQKTTTGSGDAQGPVWNTTQQVLLVEQISSGSNYGFNAASGDGDFSPTALGDGTINYVSSFGADYFNVRVVGDVQPTGIDEVKVTLAGFGEAVFPWGANDRFEGNWPGVQAWLASQDGKQIACDILDNTEPATAPGPITAWTAATGSGSKAIAITITTLPDDGGSPIFATQYSLDGGDWTGLGLSAPGTSEITAPEGDTAYSVRVRAVNAVGAGPASSAKSATSNGEAAGVTPVPPDAGSPIDLNVVGSWQVDEGALQRTASDAHSQSVPFARLGVTTDCNPPVKLGRSIILRGQLLLDEVEQLQSGMKFHLLQGEGNKSIWLYAQFSRPSAGVLRTTFKFGYQDSTGTKDEWTAVADNLFGPFAIVFNHPPDPGRTNVDLAVVAIGKGVVTTTTIDKTALQANYTTTLNNTTIQLGQATGNSTAPIAGGDLAVCPFRILDFGYVGAYNTPDTRLGRLTRGVALANLTNPDNPLTYSTIDWRSSLGAMSDIGNDPQLPAPVWVNGGTARTPGGEVIGEIQTGSVSADRRMITLDQAFSARFLPLKAADNGARLVPLSGWASPELDGQTVQALIYRLDTGAQVTGWADVGVIDANHPDASDPNSARWEGSFGSWATINHCAVALRVKETPTLTLTSRAILAIGLGANNTAQSEGTRVWDTSYVPRGGKASPPANDAARTPPGWALTAQASGFDRAPLFRMPVPGSPSLGYVQALGTRRGAIAGGPSGSHTEIARHMQAMGVTEAWAIKDSTAPGRSQQEIIGNNPTPSVGDPWTGSDWRAFYIARDQLVQDYFEIGNDHAEFSFCFGSWMTSSSTGQNDFNLADGLNGIHDGTAPSNFGSFPWSLADPNYHFAYAYPGAEHYHTEGHHNWCADFLTDVAYDGASSQARDGIAKRNVVRAWWGARGGAYHVIGLNLGGSTFNDTAAGTSHGDPSERFGHLMYGTTQALVAFDTARQRILGLPEMWSLPSWDGVTFTRSGNDLHVDFPFAITTPGDEYGDPPVGGEDPVQGFLTRVDTGQNPDALNWSRDVFTASKAGNRVTLNRSDRAWNAGDEISFLPVGGLDYGLTVTRRNVVAGVIYAADATLFDGLGLPMPRIDLASPVVLT